LQEERDVIEPGAINGDIGHKASLTHDVMANLLFEAIHGHREIVVATELTHADEYDGADDKHFCAFHVSQFKNATKAQEALELYTQNMLEATALLGKQVGMDVRLHICKCCTSSALALCTLSALALCTSSLH
jgi:hypothetical protein